MLQLHQPGQWASPPPPSSWPYLPTPLSILLAPFMQVVRLIQPIWGFPPCGDAASEARGHPYWAFKCLTSLHCGRLSGRRRILLRLSELIRTPLILSPSPVRRGARWPPQGRRHPQFNYSTWGRFAPFLLAAELTPQFSLESPHGPDSAPQCSFPWAQGRHHSLSFHLSL